MQRARRTAEIAGFDSPEVDDNLVEWDYGAYEGRTTKEIRAELGYDWTVFEHGVRRRVRPPARRSRRSPPGRPGSCCGRRRCSRSRDVLLFGHGHALRILATVFLREQPRFAARLLLDAGSVSVLEYEREQPAIRLWNSLG